MPNIDWSKSKCTVYVLQTNSYKRSTISVKKSFFLTTEDATWEMFSGIVCHRKKAERHLRGVFEASKFWIFRFPDFFYSAWPGGVESGRTGLIQNWSTAWCTLGSKNLWIWLTFTLFMNNFKNSLAFLLVFNFLKYDH